MPIITVSINSGGPWGQKKGIFIEYFSYFKYSNLEVEINIYIYIIYILELHIFSDLVTPFG